MIVMLTNTKCKHDPELIPTTDQIECDTTNVTFSGTIWPIIELNCNGCHSGTEPSGGFELNDYTTVIVQINDGKLFSAINHLPDFQPMPRNAPKLSDCKINQIKIWIENGTPNN